MARFYHCLTTTLETIIAHLQGTFLAHELILGQLAAVPRFWIISLLCTFSFLFPFQLGTVHIYVGSP